MLLGVALAAPCLLVPHASPIDPTEAGLEWYRRVHVRRNAFCAVLVYVGSYFFTHYFYSLLGVRYSVPVDGWELNGVPICMYLLAHPYFVSYHVLASIALRRARASYGPMGELAAVPALSYFTAVLETWSIEAFPHYNYPDRDAMLKLGSLFYALFFVVSYPMYARIDGAATAMMPTTPRWGLWRTVCHGLATSMLIFIGMDLWRLAVGPISAKVDPGACPPFTHPLNGCQAVAPP